MAESKKVLITLPESLLSEVDYLASLDNKDRSQFIGEAMQHYLQERKRTEFNTKMIQGYSKMAEINQKISEEWLEAENEAMDLWASKE
ncbi:MAG: CopG family transcriptional regulator [Ruminococcaceae bacterium]|nr:CopG family transcriptional regulator [Oscillospiraceae bacterium]